MSGTKSNDPRTVLCRLPREHDTPRHIRRAPPKLGVNEIRQAPEEQAYRDHKGHGIRDLHHRNSVASAKQNARHDDPQKPAMERHAALPDFEYLKRMGQIIFRLIEKHETQATA